MPIWLNDRIVADTDAHVSVLDRGFLFGDGVYELVRFFNGVGVQMGDHVARLRRSLRETRIVGFEASELPRICDLLLAAEGLRDASVYLQVTRGAAATRAHLPAPGLRPTVVAMASPLPSLLAFDRPDPVRAALREDPRWRRCDIKGISLLGNILAAMSGAEGGADETILHRDGLVGEGATTNVVALIDGELVTPPIDSEPPILHGVTRLLAFAAAEDLQTTIRQRPIRVDELRTAQEIMVTSSRRIVAPVTHLDGAAVASGTPGPISTALFMAARRHLARECGVDLGSQASSPPTLGAGSSAPPSRVASTVGSIAP